VVAALAVLLAGTRRLPRPRRMMMMTTTMMMLLLLLRGAAATGEAPAAPRPPPSWLAPVGFRSIAGISW